MAAYVTLANYVATFGERETIMVTNTADSSTSGVVDSTKVDKALDDQSALVDGYVGKRYVVPIVSPPEIVQGWVKALAREALFVNTGRMNDAVSQAADRARAQLKDVVNGLLSLPVSEAGTAVPALSGGLAMSSCDRPSPVVGCRINEFTAPFTGNRDRPRWRDRAGG